MSDSTLIGIQSDFIDHWWKVVEPLLAPAIERSLGMLTNDSVYKLLKSKDMQLWISIKDGVTEAAATTQILTYPKVKVLALPLIGGKNRNNWLLFEPTFHEYGKSFGCTYLEGYFRMGWLGVHRKKDGGVLGSDWKAGWVFARKEIK